MLQLTVCMSQFTILFVANHCLYVTVRSHRYTTALFASIRLQDGMTLSFFALQKTNSLPVLQPATGRPRAQTRADVEGMPGRVWRRQRPSRAPLGLPMLGFAVTVVFKSSSLFVCLFVCLFVTVVLLSLLLLFLLPLLLIFFLFLKEKGEKRWKVGVLLTVQCLHVFIHCVSSRFYFAVFFFFFFFFAFLSLNKLRCSPNRTRTRGIRVPPFWLRCYTHCPLLCDKVNTCGNGAVTTISGFVGDGENDTGLLPLTAKTTNDNKRKDEIKRPNGAQRL